MFFPLMLSAALLAGPSSSMGAVAPDTARIKQQVLPGVTVRPGHAVLITPLEGKQKKQTTYVLLAGTKVAVHLPPAAQGTVTQLQLQMEKRPVTVGSLRVRLLAAPDVVLNQVPETANLLGSDLILTPQQLSAASKDGRLRIDLTERNIEMPANGLVVLIEALGPAEAPEYLSVSMSAQGKSPMVVTTGPEGAKVTRLNEWPTLVGASSVSQPRTWVLGSNGKGWTQRMPREKGIVYNSLVSVVVLSTQAPTR